jgi:hypothetical protein
MKIVERITCGRQKHLRGRLAKKMQLWPTVTLTAEERVPLAIVAIESSIIDVKRV